LAAAVRREAQLGVNDPITAEVAAGVTSMSIYDTPITDLTGIECMTSLSWLTLSEVGITDVSRLAALPRLTTAYLDCNPLTDLSSVASLINLVNLGIGKSSSCEVPGTVTDITPLVDLVGLSTLDLSGHDVTSLSVLGALTHLRRLILPSNPNLVSLAGLEHAKALNYLVVTDTQVSDLSIFAGHPAIGTLWLSGSQVSDLSPLVMAPALEALYIVATPVDCDAQAANIATLQMNGVNVSSSCN
jgi:internalin A